MRVSWIISVAACLGCQSSALFGPITTSPVNSEVAENAKSPVLTTIPQGEADRIMRAGRTPKTRDVFRFVVYPNLPGPVMYECGDSVLYDQAREGGQQRFGILQPCWDFFEEDSLRHRMDQERSPVVRLEREPEGGRVQPEQTACANIGAREREHSPFAHRNEVAAVIPHRVGNRLVGVRVVFKPIAGLTAAWLRRDLDCQRARWEARGKPAALAAADPTLFDGALATVAEHPDGHLEVLIETATPEQAVAAVARANRIASPPAQIATRP